MKFIAKVTPAQAYLAMSEFLVEHFDYYGRSEVEPWRSAEQCCAALLNEVLNGGSSNWTYGFVANADGWHGWLTSGGNFTGFRKTDGQWYILAEGYRQGIRWPSNFSIDPAFWVNYETNCPSWLPWETSETYRMPNLGMTLEMVEERLSISSHPYREEIEDYYKFCSANSDPKSFEAFIEDLIVRVEAEADVP
jgi:hypothetical protein